jgi:hypothetical protein
MAFRKIQAELMNCPVNYDKEEEGVQQLVHTNTRGNVMGIKTVLVPEGKCLWW